MRIKLSNLRIIIACILISVYGSAQEKSPCKFGKISPEDFQKKIYSIDSNANAVVIADIGSSEIVGNNKFGFSLLFKRYTRVHILNKNGYDVANIEVSLYKGETSEEELSNVKAVTYNLENGAVKETKLEKSAIFKDKVNGNVFIKKFTLPEIKEGSIIEYQYEIQSPYIRNFQPWEFQGDNPVIWSEYNASIPQFFSYAFLSQGYRMFDIKDSKTKTQSFTVSDTRGTGATEKETFSSMVMDYRWVMKDVPALKEESYTSTLENHKAKMEFQLTDQKDPLPYQNYMGTWADMGRELREADYFGQQLDKNNGWLGDIEKPILAGAKDEKEKATRIYSYIRDNFTCTNSGSRYLSKSLKEVAKTKNGNEADINLLLTAMLKYADIKASPVILSTRSHGYASPIYPLITRFNYVISKAIIDNTNYYFDASVPRLGFGKLMYYCYNGHARVIDESMTPLEFSSDSLKERKISSVFLTTDESGDIKGNMQQSLGYFESLHMRDDIKEKGKEAIVKDIQKGYQGYGEDAKVDNAEFNSIDKFDEAVSLKYDISIKTSKEDIIYFSPMFGENYKNNPFKSAVRYYPVEMPYQTDELLVLNMEVPKGYEVDELPKPVRMKLNEEGDGMFEYLIQQQDDRISLRMKLIIKRTYFLPEEYDLLREFFNQVVKKEGEQIVFKKKK
jgi:transglutaminase-like putative cysteine protease